VAFVFVVVEAARSGSLEISAVGDSFAADGLALFGVR
jgi:hypothetical protein